MKNNDNLIVSFCFCFCFCFCFLITSCSQSEHKTVSEAGNTQEEVILSSNTIQHDENTRATKEEIEAKQATSIKKGKRSISFNGEKYIFMGTKLQKGSKVRQINMSEQGTVKGTFVVITKPDEILDIPYKNITKIAKNTVRITPKNTDDLMAVYNELLANKSITRVELEVVYSGRKGAAARY